VFNTTPEEDMFTVYSKKQKIKRKFINFDILCKHKHIKTENGDVNTFTIPLSYGCLADNRFYAFYVT